MSEHELSDRELQVAKWAIEDVEQDRPAELKQAIETWGESELHRRFDPGTHGSHEVIHAAYMLYETWHSYVIEHASVLMSPEAYRAACLAGEFMHQFYQVMNEVDDAERPSRPPDHARPHLTHRSEPLHG